MYPVGGLVSRVVSNLTGNKTPQDSAKPLESSLPEDVASRTHRGKNVFISIHPMIDGESIQAFLEKLGGGNID
jgi:hypothetical protein